MMKPSLRALSIVASASGVASAAEPVLSMSMDDAAAVATPTRGTSGATITTSPSNDFVPGHTGNGLRCDAIGERVLIPQTDGTTANVDLHKGTVDFWYLPFYDENDDIKTTLFGTGDWTTVGSWHLGKHNSSNSNALFLIFFDEAGGGPTTNHSNVEVANYSWTANQWVNIRVTWDFTVAATELNFHIYFDGVEKLQTTTPNGAPTTGTYGMGAPDPARMMYFGARDTQGTIIPNGVHDELRVYADVIPPGGALEVQATPISVREDAGTVTVAVTRTAGDYGTARVDYAATDQTAVAGDDYLEAAGTLSFTGLTTELVTIEIIDDDLDEADETLELALTNAQGARLLGSTMVTLTVIDDDEPDESTTPGGCGCRTSGSGSSSCVLALAALWLVRRRRPV